MVSIQPRKQRKAFYDAPLHKRRKQMAARLSNELSEKYSRRSMTVITGDEVEVLRGDFKATKGAVTGVLTKSRKIIVDGVNNKKADGTEVPLPVDASNLLITRLNLEDNRRRAKLGEKEA